LTTQDLHLIVSNMNACTRSIHIQFWDVLIAVWVFTWA